MFVFAPNHLKTKKMCKYGAKKLPFRKWWYITICS